MKEGYLDFEEYIRQGEPDKKEKASIWRTAIGLELKDRKNVLNLYLTPAIAEGYIRLLYPQSPRHPRQKYLLTMKGMALYNELTKGA